MSIIKNIDAFLCAFSGEWVKPSQCARAIYKGTSCGAWIDYKYMLSDSSYVIATLDVITGRDGQIRPTVGSQLKIPDEVLRVMGFGTDKDTCQGWTLDQYYSEACAFSKGLEDKQSILNRLKVYRFKDKVRCQIGWYIEPKYQYLTPEEADELIQEDEDRGKQIVGVRIGSIVEGADGEVSPIDIPFPTTMSVFWRAMGAIEREADRIWTEWNTDEDGNQVDWNEVMS